MSIIRFIVTKYRHLSRISHLVNIIKQNPSLADDILNSTILSPNYTHDIKKKEIFQPK